jgi:hypothetical protein
MFNSIMQELSCDNSPIDYDEEAVNTKGETFSSLVHNLMYPCHVYSKVYEQWCFSISDMQHAIFVCL